LFLTLQNELPGGDPAGAECARPLAPLAGSMGHRFCPSPPNADRARQFDLEARIPTLHPVIPVRIAARGVNAYGFVFAVAPEEGLY
jgi:hypothetical protein